MHDLDENGCTVADGLKDAAATTLPEDAMDIATRGPATAPILFLIAASAQTSSSTPNPESVEFGEE